MPQAYFRKFLMFLERKQLPEDVDVTPLILVNDRFISVVTGCRKMPDAYQGIREAADCRAYQNGAIPFNRSAHYVHYLFHVCGICHRTAAEFQNLHILLNLSFASILTYCEY